MTRWRHTVILVMAVLAAACQPETVMPMTVDQPPTTATTSKTPTTLPVDVESVDVCGRAELWDPGTQYVAECLVRPISFVPAAPGWGSVGAGEAHVLVRWSDPDDPDLLVRIAIAAFEPNMTPEGVLDAILAEDGIGLIGAVSDAEVAGVDALRATLEGASEDSGTAGRPPCTNNNPIWFRLDQAGHGLLTAGERIIGVGACQRAESWVLEVDGSTLTILAGTEDPADHPDAVEAVERLFASMSFGPTP